MPSWLDSINTFMRSLSSPRPSETPNVRPEAVLTRHAGELMRMKGVMSVGIGRGDDGKTAIIVGLSGESAEARGAVPDFLDGVPVVVKVTGSIETQ